MCSYVQTARNTRMKKKALLLGTFPSRGEDKARVRLRAHFTQVSTRKRESSGISRTWPVGEGLTSQTGERTHDMRKLSRGLGKVHVAVEGCMLVGGRLS